MFSPKIKATEAADVDLYQLVHDQISLVSKVKRDFKKDKQKMNKEIERLDALVKANSTSSHSVNLSQNW